MIGRLKENSTLPNGTVTASSEYDENHGIEKVNIYSEEPPAAWCPREYTLYLYGLFKLRTLICGLKTSTLCDGFPDQK